MHLLKTHELMKSIFQTFRNIFFRLNCTSFVEVLNFRKTDICSPGLKIFSTFFLLSVSRSVLL